MPVALNLQKYDLLPPAEHGLNQKCRTGNEELVEFVQQLKPQITFQRQKKLLMIVFKYSNGVCL
jgi:hypothetical protein